MEAIKEMRRLPDSSVASKMWSKIFSYLSYSDWQQVRLVSKGWKAVADMLLEFKKESILVINDENVDAIEAYLRIACSENPVIQNCGQIHIKTIQNKKASLQYVLSRIGDEVRSLEIGSMGCLQLVVDYLGKLESLLIYTDYTELSVNTEEQWRSVSFSSFPQLKSFNLVNCDINAHPSILKEISQAALPYLNELKLTITRVTEIPVLEALEIHSSKLNSIDLAFEYFTGDNTARWLELWKCFKVLHTLRLRGYERFLNIDWLKALSTPIKHLLLSSVNSVDGILQFALDNWSQTLESIQIRYCDDLSKATLIKLQNVKNNLRELNLSHNSGISTKGLLEGIASTRNTVLRQLSLDFVNFPDEEFVCTLSKQLPNLEMLSIRACNQVIRATTLGHIFYYLTHLQVLHLDNNLISIPDLNDFEEPSLPILRSYRLRKFCLRGCRIEDDAFKIEFFFPELREVNLNDCQRLNEANIRNLVLKYPTIEKLCLADIQAVNDDVIHYIVKHLKRLRELDIRGIPDITANAITACMEDGRSLKRLSVDEILDLNEKQVAYLKSMNSD